MEFNFSQLTSLIEAVIICILIIKSKVSKTDRDRFKSISGDIRKNYMQTLKNTVYSEKAPILERLLAFKEYIKSGGNGNCKNYSMTNLILPNKELWQSVLNNEDVDFFVSNKESYKRTLTEINDSIFS
jgi:hypothetical protein